VITERNEVNEYLKRKNSTAKLNNWVLDRHPHLLVKGRAIKMIGSKPPAFSLVCIMLESVDEVKNPI
jgi:GTP-binding protein